MSTYIHNFLAYKELLKELVRRDIKIKYRRSFLGILWSVLNPLGMMIIMTIVFSSVFRANIENFPVYLMCGQVIFNFYNEASNMAMSSILGNASLIKKVYVPKYFFPMSKVCSCCVNLLTSFIALMIVVVVTGTKISWTILFFLIPILYVFVFSLGMGLLLSALVVSFRDLQHLYGILITGWLYLTPIMYQLDRIPQKLVILIKLFNPLYYYVAQFRDLVYYGRFPGPRIFWGGWLIAFLMLAIGVWSFQRVKDKFILYI